jgi:hypothetical protein
VSTRVPDRPREQGNHPDRVPDPDRTAWAWLLLVPLVVTLWPPLYNRRDPQLFSIPFFYWYQLATVVVGVACTLVVYRRTRR